MTQQKRSNFLKPINYNLRRFYFYSLLMLSITTTNAQKLKFVTGDYDDILHIGMGKEGTSFSGYIDYNPYKGDKSSVQVSCNILFVSSSTKLKKNGYYDIDIVSSIKGSLKTKGEVKFDSNKIYLRTGNHYSSCASTLDFTDDKGAIFDLSRKWNYRSFNMVKSNKAFVYNSPADSSLSKKYLISGDFVQVLETKGEFSKIEFYGKKTTVGWVLSTELVL